MRRNTEQQIHYLSLVLTGNNICAGVNKLKNEVPQGGRKIHPWQKIQQKPTKFSKTQQKFSKIQQKKTSKIIQIWQKNQQNPDIFVSLVPQVGSEKSLVQIGVTAKQKYLFKLFSTDVSVVGGCVIYFLLKLSETTQLAWTETLVFIIPLVA